MGIKDIFDRILGRPGPSGGEAAPGSVDHQVLQRLKTAGADLDRPTEALFYIYVPTKDAAERVAAKAADSLLGAEVRRAAVGDSWLCLLRGRMVPTLDAIEAYRVKFEALAAAEGGEYDGWEAAVMK